MSKAGELLGRVLIQMAERNIPVWYVNRVHKKTEEEKQQEGFAIPPKVVDVMETYRRNGTEENVTVTIECVRWQNEYCGRRELSVKVPKDASEKVIAKRLDKIEAWFNG